MSHFTLVLEGLRVQECRGERRFGQEGFTLPQTAWLCRQGQSWQRPSSFRTEWLDPKHGTKPTLEQFCEDLVIVPKELQDAIRVPVSEWQEDEVRSFVAPFVIWSV